MCALRATLSSGHPTVCDVDLSSLKPVLGDSCASGLISTALAGLPSLTRLKLEDIGIGDEAATALAGMIKSGPAGLSGTTAASTATSGVTSASGASGATVPTLKTLSIGFNPGVGDAGAKALARALGRHSSLTYLSLRECTGVGAAGGMALAQTLVVNDRLRVVDLIGCKGVPEKVLDIVQRSSRMKARHTAGEQEIEDRFSGDRFSVGEGGSLSDEGDSVASSPSGGEGGGASTAGSEVGSASGWSDAGGGGSSGGVGFGGGSVTSATGISGEGGAAPPFRPGSGLRPPPPSSSVGLSGEGGKGGGGGQHQQQPASRGSFMDRVAQSRIGASRASSSGTGVPALVKFLATI